jgi:phage gp46-like protein
LRFVAQFFVSISCLEEEATFGIILLPRIKHQRNANTVTRQFSDMAMQQIFENTLLDAIRMFTNQPHQLALAVHR